MTSPQPDSPPPASPGKHQAVTRRDRGSKVLAVVILAAVIIPVVWLVVTAALSGPDGTERIRGELPDTTTTTVPPEPPGLREIP